MPGAIRSSAFPSRSPQAGYKLVDPGRYQPLNNDFSAQIAAFKEAGCEIVTGVMIPPDFATFWSQAAQQGFNPKVVTIGKALLFPSSVEALGDRGDGLTTEIWWSPTHPFKSSLTGQTAKELADAYRASGKPWTAAAGLRPRSLRGRLRRGEAHQGSERPRIDFRGIAQTDIYTIIGPILEGADPVKNVRKTPLVGGQWQTKDDKYELVITTNLQHPEIPLGGEMKLLG